MRLGGGGSMAWLVGVSLKPCRRPLAQLKVGHLMAAGVPRSVSRPSLMAALALLNETGAAYVQGRILLIQSLESSAKVHALSLE